MGLIRILSIVGALTVVWMYLRCCKEPQMPVLDPNPYWGPGDRRPDDRSIKQFKISIPDKDIEDLKTRLSMDLFLTPSMENTNFTYGFHSSTLEKIVKYWRTEYNWRRREKILNTYDHFKTNIEGLDIHFMRAKPSSLTPTVKVVPLLLMHGWPGSFVEFMDIIPLLTSPQPGSDVVFEVICPSIPGYAFSDAASKPGLFHVQTAQIFLKLMKRIGFEKFYVQGGDWGSFIASTMATLYPDNVLGMHINMFQRPTIGRTFKHILGAFLPSGFFFSNEYNDLFYPLKDFFSFIIQESGYLHIQATKPDSIGAALSNSPAGLAAYIMEKFSTGTDRAYRRYPDGGLLSKDFPIPLDRMLDNVNIYWYTHSITSSMRLYTGFLQVFETRLDEITTSTPAAFSLFKKDVGIDPIEFAAQKYKDIVFHKLHDGGHFIAMEKPRVLAKDVHEFVAAVEQRKEGEAKTEL